MSGSSKVRRPATLASLAAELGVSRTTVSNAYNRPDQLSAPLRERVLEAARRLGYPGPDPVARSLRTRRAGAVGLLLTEALSYAFRDPVATGFLEGLALACEQAGQGLLLVPVSPEHADVAAVHRAGVDGFVVYSVREDDPHFLAVLERPVPTVVCDQPAGVEGVDRVGVDDRSAMLGLARHLTGLGHRRVGVICMRLAAQRHDGRVSAARQTEIAYPVQRNRLAGLRDGLAEVGVELGGRASLGAVRPLGGGRPVGGGRPARGAPGTDGGRLHLGHPRPRRTAPRHRPRSDGARRPHDHRLRRRSGGRARRPDHGLAAGAGEGQGGGGAAARTRRPHPPAADHVADRTPGRAHELRPPRRAALVLAGLCLAGHAHARTRLRAPVARRAGPPAPR